MDMFLQVLKAEIQAQQRLLKDSKTFLSTAPPGHLILRKRRTTTSVYQNCKERTAAGWRSKRRSIRKDPQQIYTLIRKKLAENAVRICRHNLPILTQTLDSYQSLYPLTDTFPDFTIPLPTGGAIIWEHLGLLEVMSYAVHNGQKLHTYQTHDYLIGKNLILTQDDSRGNCSSSFIYQIIERDLLPHFQGTLNEKRADELRRK